MQVSASVLQLRYGALDEHLANRFEKELVADLRSRWSDDMRGCEQISLMGHYCSLKLEKHPTKM